MQSRARLGGTKLNAGEKKEESKRRHVGKKNFLTL